MTIFLCSPQKGGVTDHLAGMFAKGAEQMDKPVTLVPLRDFRIIPCNGCQHCCAPPWQCRFAARDDTEMLYRLLGKARMVVFASPIYFYALPAHFKAFIDRAQKFWNKWRQGQEAGNPTKPALAIMAAGRPKGSELFSGALRTLRWYGKPLNLEFAKPLVFRGLDSTRDIRNSILRQLFQNGRHCARLLDRNS